jgi:hypothetical protein
MENIMKHRLMTIVCCLALVASALPLLAISAASEGALNAFRRYEPDFANTLKRLESMARRIQTQNIPQDSAQYRSLRDEADDGMEFIQKRYDLLEDLYKSVSADYPNDRNQLFDGFQRIDDLYRQARDFHQEQFVAGKLFETSRAPDAATEPPTVVKEEEPVSAPAADSVLGPDHAQA